MPTSDWCVGRVLHPSYSARQEPPPGKESAKDGLCAACRADMVAKDVTLPSSWPMFAEYREPDHDSSNGCAPHYSHFYESTMQVKMCGSRSQDIFLVTLTRVATDDLASSFGWLESHHPYNYRPGKISMIYPNRTLVSICFSEGSLEAERRAKGWIIPLRVDRVRAAMHPEAIS